MANIMDFKSVKNNVHRSGFDLSSRMCFTAKVGEMLPVKHWDLLPGDFFKIDGKSFMRTVPVQKATFGRIREYGREVGTLEDAKCYGARQGVGRRVMVDDDGL